MKIATLTLTLILLSSFCFSQNKTEKKKCNWYFYSSIIE